MSTETIADLMWEADQHLAELNRALRILDALRGFHRDRIVEARDAESESRDP